MTSMTKKCSVEGCDRFHYGQNYCSMHYQTWKRLGDPLAGKTYTSRGCGFLDKDGYHMIGKVRTHIANAEKALGKPLPLGAQVHHIDGNKGNPTNSNLVICPNQAYHSLLHLRSEAYGACGNANHRKCIFCGQWDAPTNMYYHAPSMVHKKCHQNYQRVRNNL